MNERYAKGPGQTVMKRDGGERLTIGLVVRVRGGAVGWRIGVRERRK